MSDRVRILPVTRDEGRRAVFEWHSHHDPHVSHRISLGGFVGDRLVAVGVLGRPKAPELQKRRDCWEVTRLACGPEAPHCTASRLLGRLTRVGLAAGLGLIVSYTRIDEPGTCYLASNWTPVELVKGREHTTGNRALRWLPGLYEPSTEIIDRVRWEIGPRARALPRVRWTGERWVSTIAEVA